jgi:hypothetical protein
VLHRRLSSPQPAARRRASEGQRRFVFLVVCAATFTRTGRIIFRPSCPCSFLVQSTCCLPKGQPHFRPSSWVAAQSMIMRNNKRHEPSTVQLESTSAAPLWSHDWLGGSQCPRTKPEGEPPHVPGLDELPAFLLMCWSLRWAGRTYYRGEQPMRGHRLMATSNGHYYPRPQ